MKALFQKQKDYFNSHVTLDVEFRKQQLLKLKHAIQLNEQSIHQALKDDLNKSEFEAFATEIGYCLSSIGFALKHIDRWAKVKRVKTPLSNFPSLSYIQPEPLGNLLIIGPYNYPFQLVIEPLIGAIAAGNTAVIKPSEYAKNTALIVQKMIAETFDPAYISVVLGEAELTQNLVKLPFNHIFFTGSTRVGRAIYQMASENLTPVTLELGGKSPTIIDETADIDFAARRIVFGKFINAGQTCIAPDYIYVHESVHDKLIQALTKTLDTHQERPEDFTTIIHEGHYKRLMNLIDPSKIVYSCGHEASKRYISPHILDHVHEDDAIMQEEIFGPLLPILSYSNLDALLNQLNQKDRPLALYLFSNNKTTQKRVFSELSFGNGAINDTLMQVSNPHLPFGGIGMSGIGAYHGKTTFERFTHYKSYVKRYRFFDPDVLYPPFSKQALKLVKVLMK